MTTDISVGVRWDPLNGQPDGNGQIEDYDFEYDGGNSSSRLFERSRIRALAGKILSLIFLERNITILFAAMCNKWAIVYSITVGM